MPDEVLRQRDALCSQRKSAANVAFKLSVVRSFFEHLQAAGAVTEVLSQPAGRALTVKEVRYLVVGPDKGNPEGARDYALMLVMLRLSLRVSEVCSLRASSMKWSQGRRTLRCKVKGGGEEVWPLPRDIKEAVHEYLRLDPAPAMAS